MSLGQAFLALDFDGVCSVELLEISQKLNPSNNPLTGLQFFNQLLAQIFDLLSCCYMSYIVICSKSKQWSNACEMFVSRLATNISCLLV